MSLIAKIALMSDLSFLLFFNVMLLLFVAYCVDCRMLPKLSDNDFFLFNIPYFHFNRQSLLRTTKRTN